MNSIAIARIADARPDRAIDLQADLGLRPGRTDMRDARRLIQSCLASGGGPTRLLVPPGVELDRPIPGASGLWIDGRGVGSLHFPQSHGLLLGIDAAPLGAAVDRSTLVDSTPLLDGSVRGRIGIRLGGRQTIAEMGGLFSRMAAKPLTAITVDLAYSTAGLPAGKGLAFGWSELGRPCPLLGWVEHDTGRIVFSVGVGDGEIMGGKAAPVWEVFAPALKEPGTHRLAVQVDLAARVVRVVADRSFTWQAPVPATVPDHATMTPARRVPFKLGGLSASPANCYSDLITIPRQDATILGCCVTPAARYAGTDSDFGGPLGDLSTYFQPAGGAVCLSLADDPDDVANTRSLFTDSDRRGTALLFDVAHYSNYASARGVSISGLSVVADVGDALAVGLLIDSRLEGLDLTGSCGIGGWRMGANYDVFARRLKLTASDCAVFLDYGKWSFDGLAWDATPAHGVRAINSKVVLDNGRVGGNTWGNTRSIFRVEGGALIGRELDIDVEGGQFPTEAVIDLQARTDADNSVGVMLDLDGLGLGTVPQGVGVVRGRRSPDGVGGIIRVRRPTTSGGGRNGACRLDLDDSSAWSVDFPCDTLGPPERWPIVDRSKLKPADPDDNTGPID